MRPLRLCMVSTFYPPYNFGGDGVAIQQLARALVRRGHHVTVIHDVDTYNAFNGGRPEDVTEQDDGVNVVPIRSGVGVLSPLLTHQTGRPVVTGRAIRRHLAEGGFDVINFHNASLAGGPGILSAGTALKLYMAHEYWLVCPTHDLWRYGREPCAPAERECARCTVKHGRPPQLWRYTGFLDRQLKHVDAFIAPSEHCRDRHYEHGFPHRMEVVPNLLPDAPREDVAPSAPPPHDRPYFLYVGRLKRVKGLDDVIPAFRDYGDADLLIAGEGDHAPVLHELAAGSPRIRFLGHLPPEQLGPYLTHAIAALLPTVGDETFGMSVIEALRQSTPVLARRRGAPVEIITRCGGGELFADAVELVAAVRRLQNDPPYRERLARAGYDGYLRFWSESAVMPQYLEVVRKTAAGKGMTDVAAAAAAG